MCFACVAIDLIVVLPCDCDIHSSIIIRSMNAMRWGDIKIQDQRIQHSNPSSYHNLLQELPNTSSVEIRSHGAFNRDNLLFISFPFQL